MPHDVNGKLLTAGMRVSLLCLVKEVHATETACNVTVEAVERPEGESYVPVIAANSKFFESAEPFVSTGTNPPEIPSGLVKQLDGVWQMPTPDQEIIANKELRRDIDVILQRVKALPASRERSLCRTKLEESVMWLGMDLKRLGTPNPYPSSKDPGNTVVEPTADGLKL